MMPSGRTTERLVFVLIYVLAAVLVVQGGSAMINHALDMAFYRDYLLPWQAALIALGAKPVLWPTAGKERSTVYMQALIKQMLANGVAPPRSNTDQACVYRLDKIGERQRRVLLVASERKVVLYGLPASTCAWLERLIGGQGNAGRRFFRSRWSSDGITRIAEWGL